MENPGFKIHQFEDKGLAHYSYAILSEGEIALVDPARDPQPYYEFATLYDARIVAVIETHPHADFVSSHLEIATGKDAKIYASKLLGAAYKHEPFDDGDFFQLGKITLHAINTPGHSPDSITVLLKDEHGKEVAAFTGDTLFIGDVGRPDLRENVGNVTAKRDDLARQMYHSTRQKLMLLPENVLVYPSHGAGSLCGKGLSNANVSTIGAEKMSNTALQEMTEAQFVKFLTSDQPFVPKYFGYDVELNKSGAPDYNPSVKKVPRYEAGYSFEKHALIVDARPQTAFRKGHLPGAINLMDGLKFETWLGSIIAPEEKYYLLAETEEALEKLIRKTAKIGYELNLAGAVVANQLGEETSPETDLGSFEQNPDSFTIVDIRNTGEVKTRQIFPNAISIPLPELRERLREIPTDKPVMVHCAGGYRSAAGASIIRQEVKDQPVYDLSEAITKF
ncbi:MBL fold metallo-hydrolase [Adhaeribacter sp. BT258]|uniref:MBL fold metallo-hydrolase n=1 Tax=Adhaeribacter terrigena TaxID=2793070 RepID=A0ABS1C225_9BACT|nr:MBL fold metallo-hydrolase [Adhaeribacter terrigena]MBK0403221.1 MBL fold metallo-hydrolase [Adhaeribacter terrigena]